MKSNTLKYIPQIAALSLAIVVLGNGILVADDDFTKRIQPFFDSHCVSCHGGKNPKGELSLRQLATDFTDEDALSRWEAIVEMLESGEMPPEDARQPKAQARQAIVRWINEKLKIRISELAKTPSIAVSRRLTNLEYENTMRDLLGIDLKLIDRLPKDPRKPYRFNNTAEYMRLGPEQVQRYLECARIAMASAIVDPVRPKVHRSRKEWKPSGIDRGLAADEVGVWGNRRNTAAWGMSINEFPKTGEFRIRMKAAGIFPNGVQELPLRLVMGYGLQVNSSTLQIHPVGTVRLSNSVDEPRVFEFRGRIENHPVQPGRVFRGKRRPDSLVITPQNLYDDGTLNDDRDFSNTRNITLPRAVVQWIEFEAPVADTWPPAHHSRILFASPLREKDPKAYVREVLKQFMDRAYRRPATEQEVERFVRIYELVSPELKTMEASMRETLSMVLVSPQFLYHTVANTPATQDYELASRLSYFLWGSMPDKELLELAAQQQLDDPAQIEAQVSRLLADPRSQDFVHNFAVQWLSLEKMKTVPINRELFPRFLYYIPRGERAGTEVPYRPTIRDFMVDETVGFLAELIRTDESALNVVDSKFAYVNQPLAAHYGIEGVEGNHFRRVALKPEHQLGGLLTHGSVLIGNGTGSAPHPIYRAVWLREAILGDEVPPPPAEVPALSDSAGESAEKALTIKDLLARHRQDASCNACHARLDPWGIPFEQYNAIGRFQPRVPKEGTRVAGFNSKRHTDMKGYLAYLRSINTIAVDAKAQLPRGPEVDGMPALKDYLLKHRKHDIAENILRRMLSYALGRDLATRDRFKVQAMLKKVAQNEFRMRKMIITICQSEMFRRTSGGKAQAKEN